MQPPLIALERLERPVDDRIDVFLYDVLRRWSVAAPEKVDTGPVVEAVAGLQPLRDDESAAGKPSFEVLDLLQAL